ncbi:beta-ketoacyl-[acyl-carrier-protein] synthase family protein [bacterium]|nr:beta-ketoacyl-[acyl-carrier-protein] synthase family protein [bacterium]
MSQRQASITGLGIFCALGKNRLEFLENMTLGRCGIGQVDLFDTSNYRTHTGGQIKDFRPEDHFPVRMLRRMSRCDQIGMMAAREAIRDSGLDLSVEKHDRVSVIMGAGAGGMFSAEQYRKQQLLKPGRLPRPTLLVSFEASALTDLIGNEFDCRGQRLTVTTACSSSATAIGYGLDLIRNDEADLVIAGGSESLSEITYAGFNALRSVDPEPCRPFDLNRKGLSLGEGAGVLVLEESSRARSRGAKVYAELLSYALSADAYHMTAPEPAATGAVNAMNWAMERAGLKPDQIEYISAHGTATRHNDLIEAKAIQLVFGELLQKLPVSSVKSMVGHCLGAAGSVEAVALALTIAEAMVPPTVNYVTSDPAIELDCVPNTSRLMPVRYALSNSFAFGGNNTCLIMGRSDA